MKRIGYRKPMMRLAAAGLTASLITGCGIFSGKPAPTVPETVTETIGETVPETNGGTIGETVPGTIEETTGGSPAGPEIPEQGENKAAMDAVAEARREKEEAEEARRKDREEAQKYAMRQVEEAFTTMEPEMLYEAVEAPMYSAYSAAAQNQMAPAAAAGSVAQDGWSAMPVIPELGQIPWNTEEYRYFAENGWKSVRTSPFSTFAADVDTASYANLRRKLLRGENIPADAVRLEEMINYFAYDYPEPESGEPFSVTTEIAPCPWNPETELLMIGLQAKKLDQRELPPSNLVFLVDVSGSMDEPDKLPLVQRAFVQLTESLGENDCISLVTYASNDQVVLDGVPGKERARIAEAVEDLTAYGGTNGSDGILTAYELAAKHYIKGGNNRVILATDGDLNIGITDEGSLTRLIKKEAESGVFLSVLGFGSGNLSDARMEALADNGNGNYSYIDSIGEARRVLTDERGGTLFTVAKDVKLQVEFNPEKVKGYRLIGYENRLMAAEDFADDQKDGGELGAGHRVTVLYEIAGMESGVDLPEVTSRYGQNSGAGTADENRDGADAPGTDELLVLNLRFKEPEGKDSKLMSFPVTEDARHEEMSANLSWAAGVAQTGMLLKESEYAGTSTYEGVLTRLSEIPDVRKDSFRSEFLYLLERLEREQ